MVTKTSVWVEPSTNPYHNLALEQLLAQAVQPGEVILYLWQNEKTVVIGRNQNAWVECRAEELKADGGFLARRTSGGGAVFHDLGNLNFTFAARRGEYDVTRHFTVVIEALAAFGIKAEFTGRNDLTVQGCKFSGSAFSQRGDFCCHHGTLMIRVDVDMLSRYLTVSAAKLRAKGIASVRSRVVNLASLCPQMTISSLEDALTAAFGRVYSCAPQPFSKERLDGCELEKTIAQFSSDEWLFGKTPPFEVEYSRRFAWGEVTVGLVLLEGRVQGAKVYSDALDADVIDKIAPALQGEYFSAKALAGRVKNLPVQNELQAQMKADIAALLGGICKD